MTNLCENMLSGSLTLSKNRIASYLRLRRDHQPCRSEVQVPRYSSGGDEAFWAMEGRVMPLLSPFNSPATSLLPPLKLDEFDLAAGLYLSQFLHDQGLQ